MSLLEALAVIAGVTLVGVGVGLGIVAVASALASPRSNVVRNTIQDNEYLVRRYPDGHVEVLKGPAEETITIRIV
jgi:hypothetical protein